MLEQSLLQDFKERLDKIIAYVKGEIFGLRSGKASPSLVENMIVETYGGQTKLRLMELATIAIEGPSGLLISPFDPSTVKDIERAILTSPLHLTPRVDGNNIHLKLPPLSEEQRKQLLKVLSQKIEDGKEKIRAARDEVRKKIKIALEEKAISEDQKFRSEKEIEKSTQEYSQKLEEMRTKKEKEILEI